MVEAVPVEDRSRGALVRVLGFSARSSPLLQLQAQYVIPACYFGIGVCLVIGTFLLVSGWLEG